MAQYIMLLHQNANPPGDMSAEQIQAVVGEYRAWSEQIGAAGKLAGGQKLADDAGKVVRQGDGGVAVTDGPFGESKEVIGGFFLINAGDYAEAAEIAKTCPHVAYGGAIELRKVDEM